VERLMSVNATIRVTCTGRGTHGVISFESIECAEDGTVAIATVRQGRARAWSRGSTIRDPMDGLTSDLPTAQPFVTNGRRADHDGRLRWQYKCDSCGVDVQWNEESLFDLADFYLTRDLRVVDISILPRQFGG